MHNASITKNHLHELFDYNGCNLIWKISRGKAKAGSIAGCLNQNGYIVIRLNRKDYKAHRLIWLYTYGTWPENEIDHIDQNKSNNSIGNLRDVSRSTNQRNRKKKANNTSGITGVYWNKRILKWGADMFVNGKTTHLGHFDCKYRAASVRHLAMEIEGGFTDRHGT